MVPAPSLGLGGIVTAVQNNCHISDARHARDLTLCTFLLKMREMYRWEHDIPLGRDMPNGEVGDWMNAREHLWEDLAEYNFEPLPLPLGQVDPFDVATVNRQLLPHGLIYSGGWGHSSKPQFFLGQLLRQEERQGHTVYVAGCEYARDLDTAPGMLLDGAIIVRTEALRRWLWERYEEWRWNRRNPALARALACYPFERDTDAALTAMTECETESVILHEVGEARVGEILGTAWEAMLADLLRSRAEIMVRAVRDLHADCLSTLPELMRREEGAALHFYFANFVGMRKKLFPELVGAYHAWVETGSRAALERETCTGALRWRQLAEDLLVRHGRLGQAAAAEIETRIDDLLKSG
jgi:hypothetical protein